MEDNGIVARQFLQHAERSISEENLGDAFFYYLHCLVVDPDLKDELRERFLFVLSCWGQELESRGDYEELINVYNEALKIYQNSAELFSNLGAHLLRLNYAFDSVEFFKQALVKDPGYFPAQRNLYSSYCALVERWHYRMLNDSTRNEAYRNAIARKIFEGFDTVLDIGTGTGLFCLYAHWAGAKRMYACDTNRKMISIATNIFQKHQISDKVKLLQKSSNSMNIPEDLPERVSLVVTETMDACMLGEQILHSVHYAWTHLLKPPFNSNTTAENKNAHGFVIPHSGSLWFKLFQSRLVAKNYMFPLSDTNADDCASALANISIKDTETVENFLNLNLPNLILQTSSNEPYDSERLQDISDCVFLTDACELLYINFNNPEQVASYVADGRRHIFDVTCSCEGYIHAIGAWFTIHVDEHFLLSSAPDNVETNNCCWDQAIFPSSKPFKVFPGSKVTIASEWIEGRVTFEILQISHPNRAFLLANALPAPLPVTSSCVKILNDEKLLMHLHNAALNYLKYSQKANFRIMDLYAIPVFGLTILCNLHLANISYDNVELVCVVHSSAEEETIKNIAFSNSIPQSCLLFKNASDFDYAITKLWQLHFDVIIVDCLDSEGVFNEETICRVNCLKSTLKPGGILLPKKIMINGQLIHCDYLERCMRVVDPDINAYGIGQLMNELQVPHMLDVNEACSKYEKYSDPLLFHALSPDDYNAEFRREYLINATRSGSINAILCWYEMSIFDENDIFSTLHHFSYVNQTAFLLNQSIMIERNNPIHLHLVYHSGQFLMSV